MRGSEALGEARHDPRIEKVVTFNNEVAIFERTHFFVHQVYLRALAIHHHKHSSRSRSEFQECLGIAKSAYFHALPHSIFTGRNRTHLQRFFVDVKSVNLGVGQSARQPDRVKPFGTTHIYHHFRRTLDRFFKRRMQLGLITAQDFWRQHSPSPREITRKLHSGKGPRLHAKAKALRKGALEGRKPHAGRNISAGFCQVTPIEHMEKINQASLEVNFFAKRRTNLHNQNVPIPPPSLHLRIFFCAIAFVFAGCTRPLPPEGTLRVGIGAEVATLDPALAQGVAEVRVLSALYEGLVLPADVEPKQGVATHWSLEGNRFIFELRKDARWSNGEALTAENFVESWQRALHPEMVAPNAGLFDAIEGAQAFREGRTAWERVGIHALDQRHLEVQLREGAVPEIFLKVLAHPIFYPVYLKNTARNDIYRRGGLREEALVSNGAFRLVAHRLYEKIVVTRNENYRGVLKPQLWRIEFLPIDNRSSEELAFLSGALDITMSVPLSKVWAYRNDPRLRIDPALQVEYILVNTRRTPFDKLEARRALSLSLEREGLCRAVLRAGQTPAWRFVPPECGTPGALSHALEDETSASLHDDAPAEFFPQFLREDSPEAHKLLASLSAEDRAALKRAVYRFNSSEARKAVAEALQAAWQKNLGIEIALENMEWKTFLNARSHGDFTLARAGWSADIDDPSNFLELFLSDNPNNPTGWANAGYDSLVRTRKFAEAEKILMEALPCIPLYFNPNVYLLAPRVGGWEANPLDWHDWRRVYIIAPTPKARS